MKFAEERGYDAEMSEAFLYIVMELDSEWMRNVHEEIANRRKKPPKNQPNPGQLRGRMKRR